MKKRRVFFILIVLAACGLCRAGDLVGEKAPEIKIRGWVTDNPPDLHGLDGKVRVLDFWATWCGPCVSNIPHFVKLCSKYKPMGVEFIALSQDKSADIVRKLAREKGMNYHVAIDNGTADWFKVKSYPTVVVISHTGKVIWKGLPWESGFEKAIASAAAKAPPPLLQGIDLGPFSNLKADLMGGNDFAAAYRKIESASVGTNKAQPSNIASQIIAAINQRINDRISEANGLREKSPLRAYDIYADIVTKYGGIKIVEPATTAYLELKNSLGLRELLSSSQSARSVTSGS